MLTKSESLFLVLYATGEEAHPENENYSRHPMSAGEVEQGINIRRLLRIDPMTVVGNVRHGFIQNSKERT